MKTSWQASEALCFSAISTARPAVRAKGALSAASTLQGLPGEQKGAMPVLCGAELMSALLAGFDRLSHGIAVVSSRGDLAYANDAAKTLWDDFVSNYGPQAPCSDPAAWVYALKRVCESGLRELVRFDIRGRPYLVALSPLPVGVEQMAFAVFSREHICGAVELQMFARACQLTHAETVVLRKLSLGMSASAIASEHGVANTTVLTQIAAVRDKTRCHSVRTLLTVLARMPPVNPLQLMRPAAEGRAKQLSEAS